MEVQQSYTSVCAEAVSTPVFVFRPHPSLFLVLRYGGRNVKSIASLESLLLPCSCQH